MKYLTSICNANTFNLKNHQVLKLISPSKKVCNQVTQGFGKKGPLGLIGFRYYRSLNFLPQAYMIKETFLLLRMPNTNDTLALLSVIASSSCELPISTKHSSKHQKYQFILMSIFASVYFISYTSI